MDNVAEMPEEKYVEVDDFLRLAVKFYNTLGIDPYETGPSLRISHHLAA